MPLAKSQSQDSLHIINAKSTIYYPSYCRTKHLVSTAKKVYDSKEVRMPSSDEP